MELRSAAFVYVIDDVPLRTQYTCLENDGYGLAKRLRPVSIHKVNFCRECVTTLLVTPTEPAFANCDDLDGQTREYHQGTKPALTFVSTWYLIYR
jgi:hypothetical protein